MKIKYNGASNDCFEGGSGVGKVLGWVPGEPQGLARGWVGKAEDVGMKGGAVGPEGLEGAVCGGDSERFSLADDAEGGCFGARVYFIIEQGMSHVFGVNAYLMCPSCFEFPGDEGALGHSQGFQHLIVAGSGFASSASVFKAGHLFTVSKVPTDVGDDAVLWGLGNTEGDGQVCPVDGPVFELLAEGPVGGICFGNDDQAGGALIESMDNTRTYIGGSLVG